MNEITLSQYYIIIGRKFDETYYLVPKYVDRGSNGIEIVFKWNRNEKRAYKFLDEQEAYNAVMTAEKGYSPEVFFIDEDEWVYRSIDNLAEI